MGMYRKKPVVIEARQWDGTTASTEQLIEWIGGRVMLQDFEPYPVLIVETLEGPISAKVNDWIIKGVQGEFYPCKPDIFAATYEPAVTPGGDDE